MLAKINLSPFFLSPTVVGKLNDLVDEASRQLKIDFNTNGEYVTPDGFRVKVEDQPGPVQKVGDDFGGSGNVALQPVNNIDELYELAAKAKPKFDQTLDELAELTGGKSIKTDLKGRERALEKIEGDYRGNVNELMDVLRGTIEFEEFSDLEKALAKASEKFDIEKVKNTFKNPEKSNGYADIKLTIREKGNPNGVLSEIQLHWEPLLQVKKIEEPLYNKIRIEKDPIVKANLEAESKAIYQNFWEKHKNIAQKFPDIYKLFFD